MEGVPPQLKPAANYVRIANENANRDPVIYYWCLYYAVQHAMQIDRTSPEAKKYISSLLTTLEQVKKQLHGQEAISNEAVGQAHVEQYAMKLFNYADQKEQAAIIDKTVVHAFLTAGLLIDVLSTFGQVDENLTNTRKYAKWKSADLHNYLKSGTPYVPVERWTATLRDDPPDPSDPDYEAKNEQYLLALKNSFCQIVLDPPRPQFTGQDIDGGSSEFGAPSASATDAPPPAPQPQPPAPPTSSIPSMPTPAARTSSVVPPPIPAQPQPNSFWAPEPTQPETSSASGAYQPTPDEFKAAMKHTKFALSCMDYEDTAAAIENLNKALALLQPK